MIVGFRTRIYPTIEQEERLAYYAMCSHKMWNFVVAKWVNENKGPVCGKYGVKDYSARNLLDEFEKETGYKEIPERIALDVLQRYSQTWRNCYAKVKPDSSPPVFHKYDPNKQSFCITAVTYKIVFGNIIQMPKCGRGGGISGKKNQIPVNQKFLSKNTQLTSIKNPHFSCRYGKWYVSGSYEAKGSVKKENAEWLGCDWGIDTFFTTSIGEKVTYPDSVKRQHYRICNLKSRLEKKVEGSNNQKKLDYKLSEANRRFENLKRNFIEQTTTQLCREFNIAIEDLTNAKITKCSRWRRWLQYIAPRERFTDKLEWKCQRFGTQFIKVDPAYTSKTCSNCNYVNYAFDREKTFICPKCNLNLHRDINAAMNIAARGVCYSHKSKATSGLCMDSSLSA